MKLASCKANLMKLIQKNASYDAETFWVYGELRLRDQPFVVALFVNYHWERGLHSICSTVLCLELFTTIGCTKPRLDLLT